jgi:hypothetical protein
MRAANGEAGHEGVAVGGADLAEVLGDKSTYVKTHTLEVTASLLSYPEADAEVADRLLRSEATRSSTWMAGDYLAWYYFEGVSEAAPGFWERCTLRPAEVLLLARGAGVTTKLIERFMKQVCSQNAMKRLFDVEFIEALIGSVPAYIGTRPFKTGTRGVARFSAEAIDVLVRSERWSDALWWQDLSDAQFERLLQDEDVHNDLLDALAVTNPRHLEKLFAMWSAQEWDDWYVDGIVYRITELGAEIAHELIATTAGLAYYVLGDGPFGEYIYQLVTEAGLGAGGALEVLEAAKTRALRDVLAEATAV